MHLKYSFKIQTTLREPQEEISDSSIVFKDFNILSQNLINHMYFSVSEKYNYQTQAIKNISNFIFNKEKDVLFLRTKRMFTKKSIFKTIKKTFINSQGLIPFKRSLTRMQSNQKLITKLQLRQSDIGNNKNVYTTLTFKKIKNYRMVTVLY